MKPDEMLDHALGLLEGADHERAEAEAASDFELQARLTLIRERVGWLVDDGELEPPEGLTRRAIALVVETRPNLRRRTLLDYIPTAVPFRWADVAVAASILVAGLLTLVPAVQRGRETMAESGCVFNLQQLGVGLFQYAGQHNYFPHVAPESQLAEAGVVPVMLADSGLIHDRKLLRCPCNRHDASAAADETAGTIPDIPTAQLAKKQSLPLYHRLISLDYAYNAGYRCPTSGQLQGLHCRTDGFKPLLADQPPHDGTNVILFGNSKNHRGRGQNVLFVSGRVAWFNTRSLGPHDPDMFLNAKLRPAPCAELKDAALIPYFCRLNGF